MAIPGYKIIRKIGEGGMSSVYLAIQLSVGREIALKVLAPDLRSDPSFGEKFFREANIVGTLSHPHIVSIYDVGTHDEHYYIAMDYLPGPSCADKLKEGPLDVRSALRITRDLAAALFYAHENGIVHCDVKADNVLFRHDDSAILTDFGIATSITTTTNPGNTTVAGTPNYMSPEQTQGRKMDGRSDIYSLGILLYEMLTGDVPFKGKDAVSVAIKHMSKEVPALPADLRTLQPLINKMLAKKPGARFQNCQQLVDAVQALEVAYGTEKVGNFTTTEPTALQAFSLLEALLATLGQVSLVFFKRSFGRIGVLGRINLSRKYGLVLRDSSSDERDVELQTHKDNIDTAVTQRHTRVALEGLGDALKQNRAKRLASPKLLGLLLIATLCTSFLIMINTGIISDGFVKDLRQVRSFNDLLAIMESGKTTPPSVATTNEALYSAKPSPLKRSPQPSRVADVDAEDLEAEDVSNKLRVPEIVTLYSFTVKTKPADASIKILNIKPAYKQGMQLEPGRYYIDISKPDYKGYRQWVEISDHDIVKTVELQAMPKAGDIIVNALTDGAKAPGMIVIDAAIPFAIAMYETTHAHYQLYTKATGTTYPKADKDDLEKMPVTNVSWQEVQEYANWLSKQTGQHYRLPTENEWEIAARANTDTDYWWGKDGKTGRANCRKGCKSGLRALFGAKPVAIGSYKSNPFGLFDTSGNVAEWVADCAPDKEKARSEETCKNRVVKGGSFKSPILEISNLARDNAAQSSRKSTVGFRLALDL